MGQVARGVNPAEEVAQHRRASTVAALCERFFDTHIKEHAVSRLPKGNIAGLVTFSRIQPSAASKWLMWSEKTLPNCTTNSGTSPIRQTGHWAYCPRCSISGKIWGLRPNGPNPCCHVAKYREEKRERFLSQDELQRLGRALTDAERDGSELPFAVPAFRLLILTGCRLGEIQTPQWPFTTDAGMELPDTKTGATHSSTTSGPSGSKRLATASRQPLRHFRG